jgi:hypothetical protein
MAMGRTHRGHLTQKGRQRSRAGGPHNKHRKGALAMSITTLHEALSPSDREILAADRKRWKRLGAGAHLDDWMAFGPGLLLRRQMAMKIAKTNEPQGRQYTAAFSALMVRDGLYDATTKTEPTKGTFSAVLWLNAEPHRLEILHEILRDLTPGQRARLNSPITAGQRVKAVAIERGLEQPPKQRPAKPSKPIDDAVAVLSDRVTDLEGENAHLLEQLAAADSTPHRDGAVDFEQARHTYVTSMTNWSDKAKAEAALQLVRDLKISMMDVQKLWRATTPSMTISLSDSKRRTKKADAPAPSLQDISLSRALTRRRRENRRSRCRRRRGRPGRRSPRLTWSCRSISIRLRSSRCQQPAHCHHRRRHQSPHLRPHSTWFGTSKDSASAANIGWGRSDDRRRTVRRCSCAGRQYETT